QIARWTDEKGVGTSQRETTRSPPSTEQRSGRQHRGPKAGGRCGGFVASLKALVTGNGYGPSWHGVSKSVVIGTDHAIAIEWRKARKFAAFLWILMVRPWRKVWREGSASRIAVFHARREPIRVAGGPELDMRLTIGRGRVIRELAVEAKKLRQDRAANRLFL